MFPGDTRFPQNCKLSLNGAILFISLTDYLKIGKFLENDKQNMNTIKKLKSGFRIQYDFRILQKQHSYSVRFAEFEKNSVCSQYDSRKLRKMTFVLTMIQENYKKHDSYSVRIMKNVWGRFVVSTKWRKEVISSFSLAKTAVFY